MRPMTVFQKLHVQKFVKSEGKKKIKFYFKFAFLTRLVPLEIDLSPGKQAQR